MTAQAGDTYSIKQTLRRELRARRLSLSPAQKRRAAQKAAVIALQWLRAMRARHVALYLGSAGELSTRPLIDRLHAIGVRIAVPRVAGPGQMHFEWLAARTPLRRNRYGICEPAARGVRARRGEFDAVLLPLIGFDRYGTRLGSGGGYYDRWLARARVGQKPRYLGYAYSIQQIEQLPREAWDVRLDAVITEHGVIWGVAWPTG